MNWTVISTFLLQEIDFCVYFISSKTWQNLADEGMCDEHNKAQQYQPIV